MSLLLYFNLYAQSREGLGLTALEAGASLLPLSAALLALAVLASAVDGSRFAVPLAIQLEKAKVQTFTT